MEALIAKVHHYCLKHDLTGSEALSLINQLLAEHKEPNITSVGVAMAVDRKLFNLTPHFI